jgi:hypothetical protein
MAGFVLTIDGCPYYFGTAGLTSVSSTDADWPSGSIGLAGTLESPRGTISERMRPLDGDLDLSGQTFRLFDVETSLGEAAGYNLVTRLGTLNAANNPSTEIESDLAASGTASFTVKDGSSFASSGTCYLEQESIQFTRVGNTFTVVTRGRYGSRAVAHARDTSNSYAPALFKYFPGFTRRRVILWRVDEDNVATPLWIGYCSRAPRLASDGASYELQCEPHWNVERGMRVGIPSARLHFRGFDTRRIEAYVIITGGDRRWLASQYAAQSAAPIKDTLSGALEHVQARLRASLDASGFKEFFSVYFAEREGRVVFGATSGTYDFELQLNFGDFTGTARSSEGGVGVLRTAEVALGYIPQSLFRLPTPAEDAVIPVDTTAGLPSSWTATTTTESGGIHSTTVRYSLRADLGDGRYLLLKPSAHDAADPPTVTADVTTERHDPNGPPLTQNERGAFITRPIEIALTTQVETSHALYGIRRGLFAEQAGNAADARNWDWTYADAVVRLTDGSNVRRNWFFDGFTKFGDFVVDLCALNGWGLGVRRGRLAVVPFQGALETDTADATLTAPYVRAPQWSTLPDGLANVAELDSEAVKIVVRDQASVSRFGQARAIKLNLAGANEPALRSGTPQQIVSAVLTRVLGLWSRPVSAVKLTVPLATYVDSIFCGSQIVVSDWLAPVGDGTRGLTSKRVQVIGRELDLAAGTMALECAIYDLGNIAGYAPCVRVSSRTGTTVANISANYLSAATTLRNYADADSSGDGGTAKFAAGDRVRLIQRDTTSLVTQDLVVQSVDAALRTITFTGAIDATFQTLIDDSSKIVDLIYSDYGTSGLQAGQKLYAWVGDDATLLIGASSDPAKAWAA